MATFSRFPLPLACAVLATAVWITEIHDFDLFGANGLAVRVYSFFALGFFFSLSLALFARSTDWPLGRHRLVGAGGIGLLALYVFTVPEGGSLTFIGPIGFMGTIVNLGAALVLLVGSGPFLLRLGDDTAAWHFNRVLWQSVAFSWLAAFILFLGLALGFFALEYLLRIDIPRKAYGDAAVVCLGIIWPWHALSGTPGQFDTPETNYFPKALQFLVGSILVPLVLGYLAILYAYMAMILVQWELPRGQVAFLVAAYSVLGVATHLMAYPHRDIGDRLIRVFYRHFYHALFLPIVLLGLAIGVRINAYGFTENRYAVATLAVWLAVIALYSSLFSRRQILAVPLSLCVMLALASIGPWGAADISTRSQVQRFAALLADNGLLDDGKVVAAEHDVPWQVRKDIGIAIFYLMRTKRLQYVRRWFDTSGLDFDGDQSIEKIVAALGFEYIPYWQREPRIEFRSWNERTFDVRGFDTLVQTTYSGRTGDWPETTVTTSSGGAVAISYDRDRNVLAIDVASEVVQFDFNALVERLEQGKDQGGIAELMTLEKSKGTLRLRLYVRALTGIKDDGGLELSYLVVTVLIGRTGQRS